jgi:transposase
MRLQTEVQSDVAAVVHPYGVGIDCHSKFIAVCVLVQVGCEVIRLEREFGAHHQSLCEARDWVIAVLRNRGLYVQRLRYVLESTGCYHFPVVHVFGGEPSIVNPLLAGPYRRKTDRLDARTLAYHGISGLWPTSFFPTGDFIELRLLVLRRRQFVRDATRAKHQINNAILRWGHTIGSEGSVTDGAIRGVLEDFCRGKLLVEHRGIGPLPLPPDVAEDVLYRYDEFDRLMERGRVCQKRIQARIAEMEFETAHGTISGKELLRLLVTVPGVGPITASIWLAEVVTPRRFKSTAQVVAYIGSDPSLKVSAGKVTQHVKRKGNANLHRALCQGAQMLLATRREAFGIWGSHIAARHAKGGWAKAVGAVARRIGLGLYHVHRTGTPFTYEGYNLLVCKNRVKDEPIDALFSKRVQAMLAAVGVTTTHQLVDAIDAGLCKRRGWGSVSRKEVYEWLEAQRLKSIAPSQKAASHSEGESSRDQNGSSNKPTGPRVKSKPTASSPASTCSTSTTGATNRPCRSARRSTPRSRSAPSKVATATLKRG